MTLACLLVGGVPEFEPAAEAEQRGAEPLVGRGAQDDDEQAPPAPSHVDEEV